MDTLEIVLCAVAYAAIALGVMRYAYKLKRKSWYTNQYIDDDAAFESFWIGLFFPLITIAIIFYFVFIKGFGWLITYDNHDK